MMAGSNPFRHNKPENFASHLPVTSETSAPAAPTASRLTSDRETPPNEPNDQDAANPFYIDSSFSDDDTEAHGVAGPLGISSGEVSATSTQLTRHPAVISPHSNTINTSAETPSGAENVQDGKHLSLRGHDGQRQAKDVVPVKKNGSDDTADIARHSLTADASRDTRPDVWTSSPMEKSSLEVDSGSSSDALATRSGPISQKKPPPPPRSHRGKALSTNADSSFPSPSLTTPSSKSSGNASSTRPSIDGNRPYITPTKSARDYFSLSWKPHADDPPPPPSHSLSQQKRPPTPPLSRRQSQLRRNQSSAKSPPSRSLPSESAHASQPPETSIPTVSRPPPPPQEQPLHRLQPENVNVKTEAPQPQPQSQSPAGLRSRGASSSSVRSNSIKVPKRSSQLLCPASSPMPPPPPPPPRRNGPSGRASLDSIRLKTVDQIQQDAEDGDVFPHPSNASDILADLSKLQKEVDDLRVHYESRRVSH